LATDGLPVSQAPIVQQAVPVEAELDFTFTGIKTGTSTDGVDAPTPSNPSCAKPLSLNCGDVVAGASVDEVLASKIGATLRAYGLSGEGRALRGVSRQQSTTGAEVSQDRPASGPAVESAASRVNASAVESTGSNAAAGFHPLSTEIASINGGTQNLDITKPLAGEAASVPQSSPAETAVTNASGKGTARPSDDLHAVPDMTGKRDVTFGGESVTATASEALAVPTQPYELSGLESEEMKPDDSTASPTLSDEAKPGADIEPDVFRAALPEKFAVQLPRPEQLGAGVDKSAQRVTLKSEQQSIANSDKSIGINVAKSETLMPATAVLPTPASAALDSASMNTTPLSFDALVKEGSESGAGQLSVARRAVESVLTAADQIATGEQRSVRLQFTVGGEELAVRVEFRGDRVHTTFRTDSSELRSALAHEWQSVSAVQNGVRTQRLADPVFASHSSGNGQSFSTDSGSAHHRDSGQQHSQIPSDEIYGARRAFSNTTVVPAAMAAAPATASEAPNPLRLHTFA
jgi:hypothetical protein